jgi:Fic family protein
MLSFTPSQKIENRLKILQALAWFFINILESSLADIEIYRKRYNNLQKLSESASTVLNCFRSSPEKRLKVGDIVEKTGIPRRTVQYALKTLTKQKLLQILGRGAGSRYQLVFSFSFPYPFRKPGVLTCFKNLFANGTFYVYR